jgi:hypothetical protein
MKSAIGRSLVVPALGLLLAGCGGSGSSVAPLTSGAQDDAAIQLEIAQHPDVVEDGGISTGGDSVDVGDAAGTGPATALSAQGDQRPRTFWRRITSVERRFEIAYADTDTTGRPMTALVTVHARLRGTFNVLVANAAGKDTVWHKRLEDLSVRRVLMKRVRVTARDHEVWKIAGLSDRQVTARDAQTRIMSVRLQAGPLDTTNTDPLGLFRVRRMLRLLNGQDVTVTVTTQRDDDVVVFYGPRHRFRFHNNGDNTYTAVWRVPALDGFRHLGVNALSHGTLWDPAAPYDSQAWIFPYMAFDRDLGDYVM